MTRTILIVIALTLACVFWEPVGVYLKWTAKAPIKLARW
jgi:hypothetical protein